MENNNYSYVDSSHVSHEIIIQEEDLKLVHNSNKLHDVDLKGKTTTYFKDILHRFLKNKVSVFGFIIIALIVILSAVASLAMPEYKITDANATEVSLAPKLFPTGTGWWDGTELKTGYIYDSENEIPVNSITGEAVNKNAYLSNTLSLTYNVPITSASKYATSGGYIAVRNGSKTTSGNLSKGTFLYSGLSFDFNNNTYSLKYSVTNEISGAKESNYNNNVTPSYDIYLTGGNLQNDVYILTESQKFGDDLTVAIDSSLGFTTNSLTDVQLVFSLNDENTAIYMKNVSMVTSDTSFNTGFSFASANDMLLSDNKWVSSGNSLGGLYMATVTEASFRYDTYEAAYGNEVGKKIGASSLKTLADSDALLIYTDEAKTQLVDLKNMELEDFLKLFGKKNGDTVYVTILKEKEVPFIIDPDNPITVYSTSGKAGTTVEFVVTMSKWKYLGYSSYPIHILGTDKNGYDLLKVTATGTLYSLGMALVIFIFCFIVGLIWGSISGYFGGTVDIVMERICEIISGVPLTVLLTLFLVVFGKNWFIFIFGMCFSGWIGTASITRTQFYRFKRREYILASRSLGASDGRLIFRHILPNGMGTIITSTILMVPSIIYSEAGLAYLGLGFTDITSLGRILSDNQAYLLTEPLLILWPSLIIALLMISFELFGQGLRDAFNPSTKGA